MRISRKRQDARIRVSKIKNGIMDIIIESSTDTTEAEINLALTELLNERQNRLMMRETEGPT